MSESDIVERLGCLLRTEAGSRDHGLPEIVSAMRDAKAEIERLRAEVRHAANVCDALSALDDLGPFASVRVMADHARRFRRALGDE